MGFAVVVVVVVVVVLCCCCCGCCCFCVVAVVVAVVVVPNFQFFYLISLCSLQEVAVTYDSPMCELQVRRFTF
jgi:hypothetical protein